MSLQKALQKAEKLFPIGSKVQFCGEYINGVQKGTGTVIGYNYNPSQTGFVRVVVQSEFGEKYFSVADPNNENFTHNSSSISLIA